MAQRQEEDPVLPEAAAGPRPLRGIGRLNVEADQLVAHGRARQAELARRKRASISGEDAVEL